MNPSPNTAGLKSFQPGQSGNPAGRTNPAKRAAGEACWKALLADFTANGVQAIENMRTNKPEQYVALVASGLPAEKQIDLNVRNHESLSEEQSRLMAEEILERSKRRIAASTAGADPVHDSVPARLPTRTVTS